MIAATDFGRELNKTGEAVAVYIAVDLSQPSKVTGMLWYSNLSDIFYSIATYL